jgi:hypothetical protein
MAAALPGDVVPKFREDFDQILSFNNRKPGQ